MPFVAAANCIELAVIALQDNQPVENTFTFRLPAPATLANLTTLAGVVDTWVQAHKGQWPTNVTIEKYYLRALDSAGAPTYEQNPSVATDGTKAGTALPNDVTFSVTRYTGLAGRKNRGRLYQIGLVQTDLSGANTVDATRAAGMITTYEALRTAMLAATPSATQIILHRADGTHVDVIGHRYADLFLDSQRRRLPGHNIHH